MLTFELATKKASETQYLVVVRWRQNLSFASSGSPEPMLGWTSVFEGLLWALLKMDIVLFCFRFLKMSLLHRISLLVYLGS